MWCTCRKISAEGQRARGAGRGVLGWALAEPDPCCRKRQELISDSPQGVCSFQRSKLWVPLLKQLFHIILSLVLSNGVKFWRIKYKYSSLPSFLLVFPPPEAGASVRSFSSSCLSQTSCSLSWTWQVCQWFNRLVAVKWWQCTTGGR